jgi:hypothetical protein
MKRPMLFSAVMAIATLFVFQAGANAQPNMQYRVEVREKSQEAWKHHGYYVDRVQAEKVRELLLVSKRYDDVRVESAPVYTSQNLEYYFPSSYGFYFPSLFPWHYSPVVHQPPIVIHHPIIVNPPVIHHPIIVDPAPVNRPIFPIKQLPVSTVSQVNLPVHKIVVDPALPITRAPVQVAHSAPVHNKK